MMGGGEVMGGAKVVIPCFVSRVKGDDLRIWRF